MALDKKVKVILDGQEVEDILSALNFFDDNFHDRDGSKVTRGAMRKLGKKLRKLYSKKESK